MQNDKFLHFLVGYFIKQVCIAYLLQVFTRYNYNHNGK